MYFNYFGAPIYFIHQWHQLQFMFKNSPGRIVYAFLNIYRHCHRKVIRVSKIHSSHQVILWAHFWRWVLSNTYIYHQINLVIHYHPLVLFLQNEQGNNNYKKIPHPFFSSQPYTFYVAIYLVPVVAELGQSYGAVKCSFKWIHKI